MRRLSDIFPLKSVGPQARKQCTHLILSFSFSFSLSTNTHLPTRTRRQLQNKQAWAKYRQPGHYIYIYIYSILYYIILYCIVYFTTIHRCPGRSHVQFGLFSFGLAALAFAAAGHCVCESRHTHKSGKEEDGDETLCLFVLSCCC